MNVAADVAPPTSPWLYIAGLVAATLGVLITARAPTWLEKAKARWSTPKPDLPAPPAATVERTDRMVDLVSEAIADVRKERDEAQDRADTYHQENVALQREVAFLKTELHRRGWEGETSRD